MTYAEIHNYDADRGQRELDVRRVERVRILLAEIESLQRGAWVAASDVAEKLRLALELRDREREH